MTLTRRAQVVLGVFLGAVLALSWTWAAQAQTTTQGTTGSTTTTRASTSSTRAVTSTSRAASTTTTTTRKPATRLVFAASPTEGSPGTNITVNSVNPCIGKGKFFVLLSIGSTRLGSGPADTVGNWRFTVVVPQVQAGTYGLAATCLISRNGVDENAGIYVGPDFTVTPGSGPPPPTTPQANKSANTWLIVGLIVAVVIAIAAIAWALALRNKHRKALAAAGAGPGTGPGAGPGPGPGGPPTGAGPSDTFA